MNMRCTHDSSLDILFYNAKNIPAWLLHGDLAVVIVTQRRLLLILFFTAESKLRTECSVLNQALHAVPKAELKACFMVDNKD